MRVVARIGRAAVGCGMVAVLAGCQGVATESPTVQAPGVPVALGTIEGAPDALKTRVSDEVVTQASARRIELVSGTAQARYTLRGYLTAYPTETGDTALAFVWDVFDQQKKRAQRVSTTTVAKGQATDPWSKINETQLSKATSQSMNQVAAFLAGEPVAGAVPAESAGTASGVSSLGFAAPE